MFYVSISKLKMKEDDDWRVGWGLTEDKKGESKIVIQRLLHVQRFSYFYKYRKDKLESRSKHCLKVRKEDLIRERNER